MHKSGSLDHRRFPIYEPDPRNRSLWKATDVRVSHSQPSLSSVAANRRASEPQYNADGTQLAPISEELHQQQLQYAYRTQTSPRHPPIASDPSRRRRAFVPLYASMLAQQGATPSTTTMNGHIGSSTDTVDGTVARLPNGTAHNAHILENNNNATDYGKYSTFAFDHARPWTARQPPTNVSSINDVPMSVGNAHVAFDEQDIVFDDNGQILGGSLRALVKRFIPRRDYCPDKSYIFTFLLNARIFVPPAEILHQMLQNCMFEQNCDSDNFKKERRTRFFQNILRVAKEWTESFPYDFVDETMMQRLRQLLSLCAADQSSHGHCNALVRNLQAKIAKLERYERALKDIANETTNHLWPSEHFCGLTLVCDSASILAHQLTHIELERLGMIGTAEFVEYFGVATADEVMVNGVPEPSTVPPTEEVAKAKAHKPRNIAHYADWSNRLTMLVSSEILKHLKKRHRVKMLEFFIDVAKKCFNIGNFNSLMAIVAAIDAPAIARLTKTWSRISSQSQWNVIRHQCDPSSNFSSYRSTFKAAVWRADGTLNVKKQATSTTNGQVPTENETSAAAARAVVPFFSLELKDLTVRHHKCRRRLPNGHLNFAMFTTFGESVRQLQRWKHVDCAFERHSQLLQYVLTTPTFSERALQLASFECEPPESASDKEMHRKLKHELQWSR